LEKNYEDILWPFGMFYGDLGYFVTICYILNLFGTFFSGFGIMHQEKSGNPDPVRFRCDFDGTLLSLGLNLSTPRPEIH
jgi:hypothetical protein